MALRLPDDGTSALPLLRHLILHDDKSSTYKLGLVRAFCRAADSAAGLARDGDEAHVEVPLGLVALNWLRLYLPLAKARLPQTPGNAGSDGLGFTKGGGRKLHAGTATLADLRIGARLGAEQASAVADALWEGAHLIHQMPATFLKFANGGVVFPVAKLRRAPAAVRQFWTEHTCARSACCKSRPSSGEQCSFIRPGSSRRWSSNRPG